ncbi:MAG: hypothetical protein R6V85_21045 [Polyangia bacterium]
MYRTCLFTGLAALFAFPALAADGEENDPDFFGYSAGLKGSIGGNYLTVPEDVPPGFGELAFADGAGGFGGGGGIALEFRVLEGHLGLELDMLFEKSRNWASITYSEVVETDWIYSFTSMRIPILLEGSLENDTVRASIGVGPEFVVGLSCETEIEVTEGSQYVVGQDLDSFLSAEDANDTFITAGLGFAFKVWMLSIDLDLRYAYNLTQPENYLDRVEIQGSGNNTSINTTASHTMDARILLGVSYEGSFDI